MNLADYGMNPQAALDAPRWRFICDSTVKIESTSSPRIISKLQEREHNVIVSSQESFGKGQIIARHEQTLIAASEPRADGLAIAW